MPLDDGAVSDLIFARIERTLTMVLRGELMIEHAREMSPELDRLQGHIDRINSEAYRFGLRVMSRQPFCDADAVRAAMREEIRPLIRAMEAMRDHLDANRAARMRQ